MHRIVESVRACLRLCVSASLCSRASASAGGDLCANERVCLGTKCVRVLQVIIVLVHAWHCVIILVQTHNTA